MLPIYDIEQELVSALGRGNRLILSAPTGSGKSTQVPQMLLKHGLSGTGQIIVLQPRRLAARLLACRVAEELNSPVGSLVGYQIRFENVSSRDTKILYVTEGILLRRMLEDPSLKGVSCLVFDEFHERHLYGDISLARSLDLQEKHRPDLQLVVMSATLNTTLLQPYLQPCVTLTSEGRMFPVEVEYLASSNRGGDIPIWEQAADEFGRYVRSGGEGDVLVFMPGNFEITQTLQALRQAPESRGFALLPLHGELPPQDQDTAVARHSQRKVVVATNVAETSITIDGIRLVIDSGLARIPRYDPLRGINTLLVEKISQASAAQRAGRAGRTAPGKTLRLWTEREHSERAPEELPEIRRLDLCEVVLTLKASGVEDLHQFRWLEKPDSASLAHAEELLTDLEALDAKGSISPLGRKMLAFPMHPRYARMLLAAQDLGCVYQACLIAALTQGRDLLLRNIDRHTAAFREETFGQDATSDFWILMRAWNFAVKNNFRIDACKRAGIHAVTARQVGPLFEQFVGIAQKSGLTVEKQRVEDEKIQQCLLLGFPDRVGRRLDQGTLRCELVHNRRGLLARESVVQSPLFVAAEIREVQSRDQEVSTLLSLATGILPEWLETFFPLHCQQNTRVYFDTATRRVVAEQQFRYHDLVLSSKKLEPPPEDEAAHLLAIEVLSGRLPLKLWDHAIEQWILRLNLLAGWCPELELPPLRPGDREHIIHELCRGAFSYKDIKEKEVRPALKTWLSAEQLRLLDLHAPERLELSHGKKPKITYESQGSPHISMRIQELFDIQKIPRIACGKIPVLLHILAPNNRPVQITQDLENFWKDHYPKIKQEMQRKYPKHRWK